MHRWMKLRRWLAVAVMGVSIVVLCEVGAVAGMPGGVSGAHASGDLVIEPPEEPAQQSDVAVYTAGEIDANPCKLDDEGQPRWCYEGPDDPKDPAHRTRATYLAAHPDGSVYTASDTLTTLCNIDGEGELNWCSITEYHPRALAVDQDGATYVVTLGRHTDHPLLCKFDDEGEESWCTPKQDRRLYSVAVDAEGDVYVGTQTDDATPGRLCKYDGEGSHRWCHHHEAGAGNSAIRGIAVHPDGAIYTAGPDRRACRWGEDGQPQWCVEGDSYPHDVAVTADGRLYAAFDDKVCAFNSVGQRLWCHVGDSGRIHELATDPAGAVYTATSRNTCKIDRFGTELWCDRSEDDSPRDGRTVAVALGDPGTFPQAWDITSDSDDRASDISFARAASSGDDDRPWMELPARSHWQSDIDEVVDEVVDQFRESGRCYGHDSGLRVCLKQREAGSARYASEVLFGDEETMFLIECSGTASSGGFQRCSFRDRRLSPQDLPVETSDFDRDAAKQGFEDTQQQSRQQNRQSFEMWTAESLRGPAHPEDDESGGEAALVRLDCGAGIDFEPISSSDSSQLIDNAQLKWPIPTTSFSGGKTDDSQLVATVTEQAAGGSRETSLYVGTPPTLEEITIEERDVFMDGGTEIYRLADGGELKLPNRMHAGFSDDRPDNAGRLRLTEDASQQRVDRMSNEELREIFDEEVTSPELVLPEQDGDPPRACTLLQRAVR